MLYKVTPMGYFGRVNQTSRGPWFRELFAEDDGLEWYYVYVDNGELKYLLSSNMTHNDREDFARLWKAHNRASNLAMFAGFFGGLEAVTRHSYFSKMAIGWKVASFFAVSYGFKSLFNAYNAQTYGPVIGAYLRKYQEKSVTDLFELQDRKRDFYQIDTSQYMSYTHEDLDHGHSNYGPQPDGEAADASWLTALDKFLSGAKDHHLQDHENFLKYSY
jgi:hypothetical protein